MIWLFWIAILFCVYTYVIFPVWLHVRASSVAEPTRLAMTNYPSVSIIIAAHNEEANIDIKLNSLKLLDYPTDKLQIIFVSDGSTDATVALLNTAQETMSHLTVEHYAPAAGKPTALNKGVELATGDVLVFMDARQAVSSNCVKALAERLQQPDIGAVSGELSLVGEDGMESDNVSLYWRYEKWIRLNESKLYSTTGATGALYAIRKSDFVPHQPNVLLDDFDTPVSILAKGLRTVFEPTALVYDKAESSASGEFRRKTRTLAGNFQSFRRNPWLFSPSKNPVYLQFLSHKVFRLLVPYAMLIALIASVLGSGLFLKTMLLLQVLFYGAGLANMMGVKGLDNKLFNFIKVFLQLNAAAVAGAYRFLTGGANVRWKQT